MVAKDIFLRAYKDTRSFFGWDKKALITPILLYIAGAAFWLLWRGWASMIDQVLPAIVFGFAPVGAFTLALFLWNLASAPYHMCKEVNTELDKKLSTTNQRLNTLEANMVPHISVMPQVGRRYYDHEHSHLMWVELDVTNTSSIHPINDAEVQVSRLTGVEPMQNDPSKYLLYSLGRFNPTGICWSERFASPNQLKLLIPCGTTKSALLAFQDDSNGMWTIYNSPTSPKPRHLGGAKLEIKISSPDCPTWQRIYYIQCHPNYLGGPKAIFEFEEWDIWSATHNVLGELLLEKDMEP